MRRILRNSIFPLLLLAWYSSIGQTVRVEPRVSSLGYSSGFNVECTGTASADPRVSARFTVDGTDRSEEWSYSTNNITVSTTGSPINPTPIATPTYDVAYNSNIQLRMNGYEQDDIGVDADCRIAGGGNKTSFAIAGNCGGFALVGSAINHATIAPATTYSTGNSVSRNCVENSSNNTYTAVWDFRWHYVSGMATGTLTAAGPTDVCFGYDPGTITASANSAFQESYLWEIKTTGGYTSTGVTTANYNPTALTENTSFRRRISYRTGFNPGDITNYYSTNEIVYTVSKETVIGAITPNPATICNGSSINLVQSGTLGTGAQWQWDDASDFLTPVQTSTSSTYTASPSSTTTYYVKAINTPVCSLLIKTGVTESITTDRIVTVNYPSLNPGSVSASPSTICSGDTATLTLSGGSLGTNAVWALYTSNPTIGSPSPIASNSTGIFDVTPSATQQYWIRFRNNAGPCDSVGTAVTTTVNVNQRSVAPTGITGPNIYCQGSPAITLTKVGGTLGTGAIYEWSDDAGFSNIIGSGSGVTSINVTPTANTTYYVRINNTSSPCPSTTSAASTTVEYRTLSTTPDPITGNNRICSGGNTTLSVTGTLGTSAQFVWYEGGCGLGSPIGTGSSINVSPTTNTNYYVRAEGFCNNTSCQLITVLVNDSSTAATSATFPPAICYWGSAGELAQITVSGGSLGTDAEWQWYSVNPPDPLYNLGAGNPIQVDPTSAPLVYVRAEIADLTSPCPLYSEVLEVDISGILLDYDLTDDIILSFDNDVQCDNAVAELTATGSLYGGSSLFYLYESDPSPAFTIAAVDSNDTGIFNVTTDSTKTYYVTMENTCSKVGPQSITLTVNYSSVAPTSTTVSQDSICNGDLTDVTITAIGGTLGTNAIYEWSEDPSFGIIEPETTVSIVRSPVTTTTYYVRINNTEAPCVDVSGDVVSATITVTEPSIAPIDVTANISTICNGDATDVTITANGGTLGTDAVYEWATDATFTNVILGATTNQIIVSPSDTTTYYVHIIGTASACIDVSGTVLSTTVNVNQPSVEASNLLASSTLVCNNNNAVTLTVDGGTLGTAAEWVLYNDDPTTIGTEISRNTTGIFNVNPTATVTYYVRAENPGPCVTETSSVFVEVVVEDSAVAPTSLTADLNLVCSDENTVELTTNGGDLGTDGEFVLYNGDPTSGGVEEQRNTTGLFTVNPSVTTNYFVRIESNTPCNDITVAVSTTITVKDPAVAPISLTSDITTACSSIGATLTVNGGFRGTDGEWVLYDEDPLTTGVEVDRNTTGIFNVSPLITTTYYVRAESDAPCSDTTSTESITITVETSATPPTDVTADLTLVCADDNSVELTTNGGNIGTDGEYVLYNGDPTSGGVEEQRNNYGAFTVTPSVTTTYFVRIESDAPCFDTTAAVSVTVTVNNPATAATSLSASVATVCENNNAVTLTTNDGSTGTGGSFALYNGDPTSGGTLITSNGTGIFNVNPTTTTTYFVRTESPAPCSDTTAAVSTTVTVEDAATTPTSLTSNYTSVCIGSTNIELTTNGGNKGTNGVFALYNGDPTSGGTFITSNSTGIFNQSPSVTTTYFVRIESGAECFDTTAAVSITITVSNSSVSPTSLTSDFSQVCTGSAVELTVNGGSLGTNSNWVLYDGNPAVDGNVISTNNTGIFNVNPIVTTTYYVRAEGGVAPCDGNSDSVFVTITVDSISTSPTGLTADYTFTCSGDNVELTVIGGNLGSGAEWYLYDTDPTVGGPSPIDNNTSGVFNVNPTTTTTYYVRAENFCGVTFASSVEVTVNGSTSNNNPLVTSSSSSTCTVDDNNWHYFTDNNGNVIAAVNSNGQDLGEVTWATTLGDNGPFVSTSATSCTMGEYHVARKFTISCDNQPTSPISVRLFFTATEYADHKNVDDAQDGAYRECFASTSTANDLVVSAIFPDGQGEGITSISRSLFNGPDGSHQFQFDLDPTTPLTGNNGSSTGRFENAGTDLYIHNDGGRSSILPVELTSFTATVEKGGVALNWSTASEKNNDRFDVMRSTDGVNFVKIGEVDGNGTTSVPQNYSFLDNTVSTGVYYYQLRQVDFDGASELSKIVSVEINVTQAFTAGNFFPNPTSNATSLIVTLPTDSRISFSLFTTDGRQVFSNVYNLGKGQQRIDFDFGQLPAGTYIGSIQTESERVTKKLIIQH